MYKWKQEQLNHIDSCNAFIVLNGKNLHFYLNENVNKRNISIHWLAYTIIVVLYIVNIIIKEER